MSTAFYVLAAFVAVIVAFDLAAFRNQNRRMLAIEVVAFFSAIVVMAFPGLAQRMADLVGIGRGVDLVIYAALIWLFRESLILRQHRWEQSRRITAMVRALAMQSAVRLESTRR